MAYIVYITKQVNADNNLMSYYSNKFQVWHLLSKFEDSLETIYKSNQEYCKLSIDSEKIDNVLNFLYRDRDIPSKPENSISQCISKSKNSNQKSFVSSQSRKSSNSSESHSSSK